MNEDTVELVLKGETILTVKEYSIQVYFLMTPNKFLIKIGSGATAIDLLRRYPPGTPFAIKINGVYQFMGRTDGSERPAGEATELHIQGRDRMAALLDDDILHDKTFNNATFKGLTDEAITGAGITNYILNTDAAGHRAAVVGSPVVKQVQVKEKVLLDLNQAFAIDSSGFPPGTDLNFAPFDIRSKEEITVEVDKVVQRITGFKAEKPIEWKAGESWYGALKRELDRAGLFLRAGIDPNGKNENVFLLSEPSAAQTPIFGFVNTRGSKPIDNYVNVQPPGISDLTVGRSSEYIVRGRTGGKKEGRTQIEAVFVDEEMKRLGFTTHSVHVDKEVKTLAQAQFLARKQCAEARRMNRSFTYVIPGRHTAPLLHDPSKRAVVVPDVCVALKDDEYGLDGVFWIERVHHKASANGPTGTEVTLMVPDDLVFGDGLFLPGGTPKILGRSNRP
jgi:prophage tail gpP-like protein